MIFHFIASASALYISSLVVPISTPFYEIIGAIVIFFDVGPLASQFPVHADPLGRTLMASDAFQYSIWNCARAIRCPVVLRSRGDRITSAFARNLIHQVSRFAIGRLSLTAAGLSIFRYAICTGICTYAICTGICTYSTRNANWTYG